MAKVDVQRNFSLAASSYDSVASLQRTMADRLAEMVAELSVSHRNAVEIGCGTGFLSECVIRSLPHLQSLLMVDLSQEMLEATRRRLTSLVAEREGDTPQLSYLQADGETFSLPPQTDLWISSATVQWFSDLPLFLQNLREQLSSHAKIAFSCFGPDSLSELYSSYAEVHGMERRRQARFWSVEELQMILEEAGFSLLSLQQGTEKSESRDLLSLLKRIKTMGASYRPDHSSQLTRESLRKWSSLYRERFSSPSGGILSSWEWIAVVAEPG